MARKAKYVPPFISMTFTNEGKVIVGVEVKPGVLPTARNMQGNMRVTVGTDRLAVALTLVEIAEALVGADGGLKARLQEVASMIVGYHVRGIRMIEPERDEFPF